MFKLPPVLLICLGFSANLHEISISNNAFSPSEITIEAGDTIRWTNEDSWDHTVTEDNGEWDSGTLSNGDIFKQVFLITDTLEYHCSIHTSMIGQISVCGTELDECGVCDGDNQLPSCTGFGDDDPPHQHDCIHWNWVGDGACDGTDQQWGIDLSCYSYQGSYHRDNLCQIDGTCIDCGSDLPVCTGCNLQNDGCEEGYLGSDGGDCDCDMTANGWSSECSEELYPNCPSCCGTHRDSCHNCIIDADEQGWWLEDPDNDGMYCHNVDNDGCANDGFPFCECNSDKTLDCAGDCDGDSFEDCAGGCWEYYYEEAYVGDGVCDDGTHDDIPNLNCPEFNCDFRDCGDGVSEDGLSCETACDAYDCFGNCYMEFGMPPWPHPDQSWIGDGFCDDGTISPFSFACPEFDCDDGDCLDECGVCCCNGYLCDSEEPTPCGIPDGECDCNGNGLDCSGVCGGDDVSCLAIEEIIIPEDFSIHSIYPNPFNPITSITYGLPEHVNVQILVYDISGKQIETLINEFQTSGYHTISWNASSYPSNVYFIRMDSEDFTQTQKVLLVK